MDGKHILIKQPRNSGSYFFNYKGLFSIVLLALVDVNYSFIYVDVRSKGRSSDGGVSKNSSLVRAIGRNKLKLPPDRVIVEGMDPLPYNMVADDPFSLRNDLMKPYPFRNLSREKIVFIIDLAEQGESWKLLLVYWQIDFASFYHQWKSHRKTLKRLL